MIPDRLYESLPYLYLIGGLLAILALETPAAMGAGAVLYVLGGLIWVRRSNYRRIDRTARCRQLRRRWPAKPLLRRLRLPFGLYESLPFLYIGAGGLLLLLLDSPFKFLSATLLVLAGWLVLMRRQHYRRCEPA